MKDYIGEIMEMDLQTDHLLESEYARRRPRRSRHRMPKRGRYIPQGSIDLQYRRWLRSGGFFHVVGSIRYGDSKGFYALVRRALNYAVMEKGGDPGAITSRDVIDFSTVVTEHIRNAPWKRTSGSSAVKKIAKAFLPRWSCETRQPGGGKGRCYGKIFLPVPPAGLIRNILRRNRYR